MPTPGDDDANTAARTNVLLSNSVAVVPNVLPPIWLPLLSNSSKEPVMAWLFAVLWARSSSILLVFAICAAVSTVLISWV